jgi:hypothetical protein
MGPISRMTHDGHVWFKFNVAPPPPPSTATTTTINDVHNDEEHAMEAPKGVNNRVQVCPPFFFFLFLTTTTYRMTRKKHEGHDSHNGDDNKSEGPLAALSQSRLGP